MKRGRRNWHFVLMVRTSIVTKFGKSASRATCTCSPPFQADAEAGGAAGEPQALRPAAHLRDAAAGGRREPKGGQRAARALPHSPQAGHLLARPAVAAKGSDRQTSRYAVRKDRDEVDHQRFGTRFNQTEDVLFRPLRLCGLPLYPRTPQCVQAYSEFWAAVCLL